MKTYTKKESGIYLILNPQTMHTYVGCTKNLNQRSKEHNTNLRHNRHYNKKLQEAYNSNPNFEFIPIPTENISEAASLEQSIINEYIDNPLFLNKNKTNYTDWSKKAQNNHSKEKISLFNLGRKRTEESRKKQSITTKGVRKTTEHIEKIRLANKGKKRSDTTMQAILKSAEKRKGIPLSEEHKNKISISNKIRFKNPEERMKISNSLTGRPVSQDTRNKISISNKGKKRSDETKQKLREVNSKPISIDGKIFPNMKEASIEYGVSICQVNRRLNNYNGKTPNWKRL